MNARIEMLLDRYVVQKIQKRFRREKDSPYALAEDFHEQGLSGLERSVKRLTYMLEQERPVVFKDERIGLIRTVPVNYEIFTEDEWKEIKKDHYIHEQGKVCNINPRYGLLLDRGFDAVRREIERQKGMYALDGQGGPSAQGTGGTAGRQPGDGPGVWAHTEAAPGHLHGSAAVPPPASLLPVVQL